VTFQPAVKNQRIFVLSHNTLLNYDCKRYHTLGHKLRFPQVKKAQFVTVMGITLEIGGCHMQSTAKDVTTYLEEVPPERKAALAELRKLCLATLTGFEESMTYGMPAYSRNGVAEVGFASQKHFIALYILRTDVMKSHADQLKGAGISHGKGCIRYSKPEKIDFEVVAGMLKDMVTSSGAVC